MTAPAAFGVTAADYAARAAATKESVAANKTTLGKEDFLSILVAQLKNQDPLSPMEGTEFATQLAQFSNVEQLVNINSKLDAEAASAAQNQVTAQTALGSSLIGRQISYVTDKFSVVDGEENNLRYSLGGDASVTKIEVLDSNGKVVFTENQTNMKAGEHTYSLNDVGLEEGNYTWRVTATAKDNSAVSATEYGTGTVSGVSFKNGQIMLHIGSSVIPLLEINQILNMPAAPTGTSATNTESSTS